jgi:hypothetical protein
MPTRPPIMLCPVCGVAMLASKSKQDNPTFDTFRCLRCDSTINLATDTKSSKPKE